MQGDIRFEECPTGWMAHSSRYRLATQGTTREDAQRKLEALEDIMVRLSATRIMALTEALSESE